MATETIARAEQLVEQAIQALTGARDVPDPNRVNRALDALIFARAVLRESDPTPLIMPREILYALGIRYMAEHPMPTVVTRVEVDRAFEVHLLIDNDWNEDAWPVRPA